MYIAARDARVQAVLTGKLLNPTYVFEGVRCLDDPGIPEQSPRAFSISIASRAFFAWSTQMCW